MLYLYFPPPIIPVIDMKIPFELMVTEYFPAARALIAKKLVENYELSQKEAAERLGVTQPAISQYKRNLRGYRNEIFRENSALTEKIEDMARRLSTNEIGMDVINIELFELFKTYLG